MEEKKKGPGICRNRGRCMKLNLKPGQGVIVGLHECIFAHTHTKRVKCSIHRINKKR